MRISIEGKYVQREAATRATMEQVRSALERTRLSSVADVVSREAQNEDLVHTELSAFLKKHLRDLGAQVVMADFFFLSTFFLFLLLY